MDHVIKKAKELRKLIYIIAHHAGGGHIASAFSASDIISTLYFGDVLKYDAQNPNWDERDRFILSKGHACYALYAALGIAGYFSLDNLKKVCKVGALFGGHPKRSDILGIEASTGALGHGLSIGIGMAYALKKDNMSNHVYVLLGDGECQEGSIWEGALSAPTLELNNLTVIIDYNKLQAMDELENIVRMRPLFDKWNAFGWSVMEIDGHDHKAIRDALLYRDKTKPVLIIANTIKGKGVSFMENIPIWHYRMPNEEELSVLMKELELTLEDLEE